MNLLVVLVYWSVLHAEKMEKYADKPIYRLHSIVVHTLPLAVNILNFCVTDIVFKASHALVLLPIGIAYCYHNYTSVVRTG